MLSFTRLRCEKSPDFGANGRQRELAEGNKGTIAGDATATSAAAKHLDISESGIMMSL